MRALIIAVLYFSTVLRCFAWQDVPPVRNFTTKEYGRDFHPSNMSVIQDCRGLIYSANGFMLLEYDSHSWNSYPSGKKAWILSLASDSTGIIYAGSQNEFGYFAPDRSGKLVYSSISDSLNIEDMDFTNVWKVHCLKGKVIFQSEEKIFIYSNGKIRSIKPETSFHLSFVANGTFYVRERENGLLKLEDDRLLPVEGSGIFANTGIFMMVPISNMGKKILIGTRGMGLWIYDPESRKNRFTRIASEDEKLLERSIITGGVPAGNGNIAVGTMLNGVIMIDPSGKVLSVINKGKGLYDNEIKDISIDMTGNIWAGTNNGISNIEITSPLSLLNEKTGIRGSVNAIYRYKGFLFAGTNEGLFTGQNDEFGSLNFKPVPGLAAAVRSMAVAGNFLVIGTDNGMYESRGEGISKVSDEISYVLFYEPSMKLLFSGGRGISVYRENSGRLQNTGLLKDISDDIIGFSPVKTGDTLMLWAGTRYNGAMRILIKDGKVIAKDIFGNADGLPEGPVVPSKLGTGIVFGTGAGLFRFIDERTLKDNLPDSLKGNTSFMRGYFAGLKIKK
ncbi:MAG TPA: hypothetical protein VHO68_08175 [Bacteroidales bacterium]|nr:hypothetical protein [Bacteroidales bacterium]